MFFIISVTLLLLLAFLAFTSATAMKEYESKPRLFSKNSFIFTNTGSCTPETSMANTGVKLSLFKKKDPSPSTNPSSQLLVITISESFGLSKFIRLVFILFFNSKIVSFII
ncbi:hypothetical protein COCHEDRAFT_1161733 [Bipolaris maydis C5]|uniref:Uncharacterized protein n=2 Tax=Bipolaris TaxID=33194 RepID=M2TEV0_COCH5|nr:uncharacterized protein COCMIDRAFT_110845 [Bipolaris oryzae ATCC 44560]EMD85049.1 hypothetical protein COCHEDRAFT_1161733 [Bipolaris maydis C5]EUC39681.1 hypothetical protein COCMIDRAFT_110845 [Bipolaris oryzae ATCC 44560]